MAEWKNPNPPLEDWEVTSLKDARFRLIQMARHEYYFGCMPPEVWMVEEKVLRLARLNNITDELPYIVEWVWNPINSSKRKVRENDLTPLGKQAILDTSEPETKEKEE